MKKFGTIYGGWYIPDNLQLDKDSIVYSAGVGEDISFDLLLHEKYRCNVHLIDPTEKSIKHFKEIKNYYKNKDNFSGNIQPDYIDIIQNLSPNLHQFNYYDKGLWDSVKKLKFYKQVNQDYVSQSLLSNFYSDEYTEVETITLESIMNKNNHKTIDLLKLDIEGAELNILEYILERKIFPKYLLVEFDLYLKKKDDKTLKFIEKLKNYYDIVMNDNMNITFIKKSIKIIVPDQTGYHSHVNDTFRELVKLWEKENLIEIEYSVDTNFCWLNEIGDILLYDRPTIDWFKQSPEKYNKILFGNHVLDIPNSSSWIFWARRPELLENTRKILKNYDERDFQTIFIGKIENNIQAKFRNSNWSNYIDKFVLLQPSQPYIYTQQEYLEEISKAKFGLCLRGYGPKCNREIEYMGLGVVPIVTPDVDLTYFEPLQENIHYIKIKSPEEISKLVTISKEKWQELSKNCLDWYDKNCSVTGAFNTTLKVIENINSKNSIQSFCTVATKGCYKDLQMMIYSLRLIYPKILLYIISDSFIEKIYKDDNSIITLNKLDIYGDCNREKLEKEKRWLDFMLEKCTIIEYCLNIHQNTMFLDSDIIILNEFQLPTNIQTKIGLCPHFIKKENCDKFGYYNGGLLFVNNKNFAPWWRIASLQDKTFYEQYPLTYASNHFDIFEFESNTDYGWWRMFESENSPKQQISKWKLDNSGNILVSEKKLDSVHTHIFDQSNKNMIQTEFNKVFISFLQKSISPNNILLYKKYLEILNSGEKINILFQYYNDNPERQKELDFCVIKNLEHPMIKKVINFKEINTTIPENIKSHKKYHEINYDSRLKYSDAFDYCNNNLNGELCMILNCDTFLFETNTDKIKDDTVACLSRWEFDGQKIWLDQNFAKLLHSHTQDAWMFRSPKNIKNCDFSLGKLGCDNAIADRIHKSGYRPINLVDDIKIVHYDICRGKNSNNFMKKHNLDNNEYPEELGYRLIPNYNLTMNKDIEYWISNLKITDEEIYNFISDIFTKRIKINNRV